MRITVTSGGTASGPRDRCAREPRISRTSASSNNGGTASSGSASGWLAGIAPLPSVVMTTGAPRRSANATSGAATAERAAAGEDHGALRAGEHAGRFVDQREVGLLRAGHVGLVGPRRRRTTEHGVPAHLERVRPRTLVALERGEHRVDETGDVLGTRRVLGASDDTAQHRLLVGDLVQHAAAATEVRRRAPARRCRARGSHTRTRSPARPPRSARPAPARRRTHRRDP